MTSPFWSAKWLREQSGVALEDLDDFVTYQDLDKKVEAGSRALASALPSRAVVFLKMRVEISCVIFYLACLRSRIVPLLLPESISDDLVEDLARQYRPCAVIGEYDFSKITSARHDKQASNVADDLAILLSTSGSTGSSKLVMLSYQNLQANAGSIANYLTITKSDRAHLALPLSYSYGLSVLHSHLLAGASVYLSKLTPFSKGYRDELVEKEITSLSGVPFFYQMLIRSGFFTWHLPHLRVITQAGGKLASQHMKKIHTHSLQNGIRFFVMYGQTEATARISYVPPERLAAKIGSIGIAIPEGKLWLSEDSELIYSGPNVMMGYAQIRDDLATTSSQTILMTGDLASMDSDGYFYITGRLKRFIKIAGSRYGLDEIESRLEEKYDTNVIVTGVDERLLVFAEHIEIPTSDVKAALHADFGISAGFITVEVVETLNYKPNGKKDYSSYLEGINES